MDTAGRAGQTQRTSRWAQGLQTRADWLRLLGVAAGCGVLLGVLGPFGSFLNGSFAVLLAHWVVDTTLAAALAGVIVPPLFRVGRALRLPWALSLLLSLALFSVPVALLARLEAGWVWPGQTAHLQLWDWYGQALFVSLCVTGVWLLLGARPASPAASDESAPMVGEGAPSASGAETASPPVPAVLSADTSPTPHARADATLCLQMEDHYVRIHHPSGSQLELMSLQDAIGRFGSDGLQVHRSWWVASRAVIRAEREGRNWRLRLSNGIAVPIARNRIAAVRARGWLGD